MKTKTNIVIAILFFFIVTVPFAFERPSGGRSGERQGQTAGIIRIYCQNPDRTFLEAPQIHMGNGSFNLEFTIFEWLQGGLARLIDGPKCDSVEPVAKNFSIFVSGLGILAIALIASTLWGNLAGLFAAFLLATDALWLRYSTYSMVENRTLVCALFGMFFSIKRKPFLGFLFWSLTLIQKPQIFSFIATVWGVVELTWLVQSKMKIKKYLSQKKIRHLLFSLTGAFTVGIAYFFWSTHINKESDLPWIMWTGPRVTDWYFGNWSERFNFVYFKSLILDWIKRTGLNIALPLIFVLTTRSKWKLSFKTLLLLTLPYLIARFAYSFIFLNTFKAHEYAALPLNVGSALFKAATLNFLIFLKFDLKIKNKKVKAYFFASTRAAFILILIALPMFTGLKQHWTFAQNSQNKNHPLYFKAWNQQVFPKENSFVVMAGPGSGRDLLHLYLTKQRGFMWCNRNPKYAPRKFWKRQGVKYVAWAKHLDPKTGIIDWVVRSIDDEMAYAKKRGWSTATNDPWAAKSMSEWAAYASAHGKDPCGSQELFNPQNW